MGGGFAGRRGPRLLEGGKREEKRGEGKSKGG